MVNPSDVVPVKLTVKVFDGLAIRATRGARAMRGLTVARARHVRDVFEHIARYRACRPSTRVYRVTEVPLTTAVCAVVKDDAR